MSARELPAKAEHLFRYLFEQASLGIAVEDLDGNILVANPTLCSMLGYAENELAGLSCSEFASPEDSEDDWALFQQLRAGVIDHYTLEKRYKKKNGAPLWGRLNVSLLKQDGQESPLVFAFVEDITEHKLAEQELARTNDRFRLAMEASKSVGWEWDPKSGGLSWFGDLQSMFGIPSDSFEGGMEDFYRHMHPEDQKMVAQAVADARQNRKQYAAEFRVLRGDGTVRWVAARGTFNYEANGDPARMMGTAVDITDRRLAEEALRESEHRFRSAVQAGRMYAFEWDVVTDKIVRSKESADILNWTDPERDTGGDFHERIHPDDRASYTAMETRLTPENPAYQLCFRIVGSDGSVTWLEDTGRALFDAQRKMVRVTGIVADITERKRAEEKLRESEERFRLAAQAGKMYAFEWDPASDTVTRSEEYGNIIGVIDPAGHLTRRQLVDRVHPDDRDRFVSSTDNLTPENPTTQISYRVFRPDGSIIWLEKSGRAFFDAYGRLMRVMGMVVDITERKQAEERLREYEKAVEGSGEMIAVVDREYRYLIANRRFLKLRNLTKEQVVGRLAPDVLNKGVFEEVVKAKLDECFAGNIVKFEMRYTYPGLGERDLFVSYFPIEGPAGVDRAACILLDITEQKRVQEALKKSEEKFAKAFHHGPMAVTLSSARDSRYLDVNETFERITGWRRDEVIGRTSIDIGLWVNPDERFELVKRLLTEQSSRNLEFRFRMRDGSIRIGYASAELIDLEGEPCMLAVIADITDYKRSQEALRESEARERSRVKELEAILDAVPVPVLIAHDAECLHITGNRAASEQLREVKSQNLSQSAPPGERPAFRQIKNGVEIPADSLPMQLAAATGKPVYQRELTLLFEDGTTREEIANAVPFLDENGKVRGAVGASIDVTELKKTERALRESEDKLRLLLDSTAEAIYGIDLEHRCTFCNPAALRALGYEHVDEVLGKNMHKLIHHTRADGTPFPQKECRVHGMIQSGEGIHADDDVLWRANGTSFPAEYWSYPQRRGQEVIGAVVAFFDITERKLAEAALANVSRKLIEAQEQERTRIGRELHDDIGQRLALVAVQLQQLQKDRLTLPSVRSRLGELQKKVSEIAADTQSLSHELHSARLQYLGITAAMRGFCREFGEQQKVKVDFRANDLPAALSPDISLCLFRVLQEALHNSAKHSEVRRFEVRLWGSADEIRLTVKDAGKGFNRERAKASHGLGLISMEERLKIVSGTLSIESQPGRGTTVEARVPVTIGIDSMRAAG